MEDPVVFGTGARLLGVVTVPSTAPAPVAAVFLTAGLMHHVGPHRIYVQLARSLAARGLASIRFDRSGVGDSESRTDERPFAEAAVLETREAMDVVQERLGIERFVLVGICLGGTQALLAAAGDPRAVGAIAVNPQQPAIARWPDLRARLRKLRRYYWRLVLRRPLGITGALVDRRARPGPGTQGTAPRTHQRAKDAVLFFDDLLDRGLRIHLVYSESELTLDYLHVVLGSDLAQLRERGLQIDVVRGADHVFSIPETQADLAAVVESCVAPWTVASPDARRAVSSLR